MQCALVCIARLAPHARLTAFPKKDVYEASAMSVGAVRNHQGAIWQDIIVVLLDNAHKT